MHVLLDDPNRADEFILFLDAAGFAVDPGGVLPVGDFDGRAHRSLELHLELWNQAHPDATATLEAANRST